MKLTRSLWILFLLSSCAHETLAQLKEVETENLRDFDLCARNNATELLSSVGEPGEIADFVMNSCDSQFQHYKDAVKNSALKRNTHPEETDDIQEKAEKRAQDMWDKIRLKVIKLVEKKGKSTATP